MFDFEVQKRNLLAKAFRTPHLANGPEEAVRKVAIRLVRNWPAEPVLRKMIEFGNLVGINLQITLSPYADSLILEELVTDSCDMAVFWLDEDRLSKPAIDSLVRSAEEIASARPEISYLLVIGEGMQVETSVPNLGIVRHVRVATSENDLMKYGHRFASPGYLSTIRKLVVEEIATSVFGPYRLIAVDFDNTLYEGILGEDYVSGISFSASRIALIKKLEELATKGCLLFGLTKNDSRDMDSLFAISAKFGLTREMFWRVSADWTEKPERLKRAVEEANLDLSMTLFIDDNIAELERMAASVSQVDLLGSWNPDDTLLALNSGHRIPATKDLNWRNRISDLASRSSRLLNDKLSPIELHRKLGSQVLSSRVQSDELDRAQELILKTNQFNVSLGRTGLRNLLGPNCYITCAEVSDKLGDSGIVAVLVSRIENSTMQILEFCISCRVLGRGLEDIIFASLVEATGQECDFISIRWRDGPRNKPAIDWLNTVAEKMAGEGGTLTLPNQKLTQILDSEAYELVAKS